MVLIKFIELPVPIEVPEALLVVVTVPRVVDMLVIPNDAPTLVDEDDREVNVMKVEGGDIEIGFDTELREMLDVAELGTALWD